MQSRPPQEDHEVVIGDAVAHARTAYRRGERPSHIIRALMETFTVRLHYWNSVLFVAVGCRAFGLTIGECKDADHAWRGGRIDEDALDAYLAPLIEARRAQWENE